MKKSSILVGGIVLIALAGGIYMYSKKQIPHQKTKRTTKPPPIIEIPTTSNTQQVLGTPAVTKNIPEDSQSKLLAESNTTVTQTNANPTYVPPATSPITKPEEKPPTPVFVSPPVKPPIINPPTNTNPPETHKLDNCIIIGQQDNTWGAPYISYVNGKWVASYYKYGLWRFNTFDNPKSAYNWLKSNGANNIVLSTDKGLFYIEGFWC